MTLSDFAWNEQIDPALFNLTPPKDYDVQTMKMDMSPPTEKDVINGLRAYAQLNDGQFPDTLTQDALADLVKRLSQKQQPTTAPMDKALQTKLRDAMFAFSRACMFSADPANGTDWHYAARGVKLGETDRPVFWYRPKDATSYHVIYADLSVHEVSADRLPRIPSVELHPAAAPTTAPAN